MIEFVIARLDGDPFDFNLDANQYPKALCPINIPSQPVPGWGNHRIKVDDCEISFSEEFVGFQVSFNCDHISRKRATEIVEEIRLNIERISGNKAEIIEIS